MSNIALRINGPAIVTYKGATFYSKDDVKVTLENETFDVVVDRFGNVEKRSANKSAQVTFTPDGRYTGYFGVLFPYGNAIPGTLTTPVKSFLAAAINTATDTITCVAHGYSSGDAVRFYTFGTMPTGLTAGTRYFVRAATVDTMTVHTTRAAALAGTGAVDITAAGTGEHRVIAQEQLTILSIDGASYVFDVAAIAEMPAINALTTDTLFGAVTFDCYRGANIAATTANSLFTHTTGNTYTEPGLDPSQILTQPYVFTWGAAPWSALETVGGFKWAFPMSTEDVVDDTNGRIGRRITSIDCTVSCQPIGITSQNVIDALFMQGAGAGRGARLGGANDFVMTGTGVSVTAKGAGLRTGPHSFGRSTDRIGELEWFATRTFNAGVPQPMFVVA